jgi:hypothetical protein
MKMLSVWLKRAGGACWIAVPTCRSLAEIEVAGQGGCSSSAVVRGRAAVKQRYRPPQETAGSVYFAGGKLLDSAARDETARDVPNDDFSIERWSALKRRVDVSARNAVGWPCRLTPLASRVLVSPGAKLAPADSIMFSTIPVSSHQAVTFDQGVQFQSSVCGREVRCLLLWRKASL